MKTYNQGQRIKIELFNNFHNTSTIAIATINSFEDRYWKVELPLTAIKRAEKKLCGMSDCCCKKITSAIICKEPDIDVYIKGVQID